jgi:glycine/D-amino acid oxidase-like deaminating enzyme
MAQGQIATRGPTNMPGAAPGMYRPVSGWLDIPGDIQPRLEGAVSADVIVVGGGVAGLSTALELKARGADVILIEREFGGFGASGRSGGYVVGAQNFDFSFVRRVGQEHAKRIVACYQESVAYVDRKLSEYGIDCDYYASGTIKAGVHPSQEAKLRQLLTVAVGFGVPARFLDHAEMRARGIPPAFLFGFFTDAGGTLDPGKYVLGLRRAALHAGVKIYEKSALLSYSEGITVRCETAHGRAQAPFMVLATNGYTEQLGLLKDKTTPVRASLIETEPLSPAQVKELGWPNREGLLTAHHVLESYRFTARNTLIVGVKMSPVYGSTMPNVPDAVAYRALRSAMADRFPALREQPIRACWSCYVSYAEDGISVVGEIGDAQNILYVSGCSGRGLAAHSFIGHLLAEKINGVENPHLTALRHETPKVPPEPLRWGMMKSMLGAAHMLDEHLNRKIRKAAH